MKRRGLLIKQKKKLKLFDVKLICINSLLVEFCMSFLGVTCTTDY